jgi:hypothetical protein
VDANSGRLDAQNLSTALDHYAELAYVAKRRLPPACEARLLEGLAGDLAPLVRLNVPVA